jgi:hypothetical protein
MFCFSKYSLVRVQKFVSNCSKISHFEDFHCNNKKIRKFSRFRESCKHFRINPYHPLCNGKKTQKKENGAVHLQCRQGEEDLISLMDGKEPLVILHYISSPSSLCRPIPPSPLIYPSPSDINLK